MLLAGKANQEGQEIPDAAGSFVRAEGLGSLSQICIICAGRERPLDVHRALGETELCLMWFKKLVQSPLTQRAETPGFPVPILCPVHSRFSTALPKEFSGPFLTLSTAGLARDITFMFSTKVKVIN